MELITVASSGNVMITNAAVSPGGRLFGPVLWRVETKAPNEGSIGPDGCYDFPNSQAPRVNRPYEVFKVTLP